MVQPLRKTVGQFPTNLKMHVSYVPAIPLLGIYLREMKTYIHKKTGARVFITALSVIPPTCQQSKCLPTGEQIKTLQHIHTTEYYLAIMNKE